MSSSGSGSSKGGRIVSILDKKMYLADLEKRLNDFIPANDVRRIVEQAADALMLYDMTTLPTDGGTPDDSDNLIKLFLDAKGVEGRSETTISHYRYILNRLKADTHTPLAKMTVHHLRSWLMAEKDRGIALRTLEGNRYVFTSFFGWAWKEELIPKNPTINLAPIKQQKTIRKPYSPVEIEKIKAAASSTRDLAIITFLLSTGCRISEVCALDVLDIDFRSRSVKVLGKGNKERVVYLDDVCVMYLDRYFQERSDDREALFLGKGTDRMTPHGVRAMLKRLEARSGVENVHPHRFRRTLATNLIGHGMAIQEVAAVLGHDKLDTTMKYVYLDRSAVENSYRKYA